MAALMVILVMVAIGSLVLGGHDALLSHRPPERLLGATFLLAGVAILAGILSGRRGHTGWAVLCFVLGSTTGLLLVSVQVSNDQGLRAWLWLLIALPPLGAALVTLKRDRRNGSRLSDTMLAAVIAAVATVFVSLFSLLGGAFRPVTEAEVFRESRRGRA